MDIIDKIRNNIVVEALIEKGDIVLVGFSGGPDSSALLSILSKLAPEMKFSLAACYINHMIRPAAVRKEIEYCWGMCKKLKIDFHIINEDIPLLAKEMKMSVETAGHEFRKAALSQLAYEDGYDKIALGHHLDDTIETILFRLFRGTGPQGLNPIRPKIGNIIRPLYNLEKEEIEKYCKTKRINPVIDKSNKESVYSRNYIRNKMIPVIEKHFGNKYKGSIANFSRIISEENQYLADMTEKKLDSIMSETPGGKIIIDSVKFEKFENWLKRRALKQILSDLTGHFGAGSFDQIERVIGLLDSKMKAVDLPDNTRVIKENGTLVFMQGKSVIETQLLSTYTMAILDRLNCRIECKELGKEKAVKEIQKNGFKVHVDLGKVSLPLKVRSIKTGDRFRPLGMRGTKKVGDYLTDKKISASIRDEVIVITDNKNEIVWLVGHQISDRVKINNKTKRILEIERVTRRTNR